MDHPSLTPEEITTLLGSTSVPVVRTVPADRDLHGQTSLPSRPVSWLNHSMRAELVSVHNDVAQKFATSLAQWLRTWSEVKLLSIEEASLEETTKRLDNPTCFTVIRADASAEPCYWELNLAAVFPLIDRLLGGGQVASPPMRRELTDIESRLMQRVARLWIEQLLDATDVKSDLTLKVERTTNRPIEASSDTHDVLAVLRFELSFGDVRGHIHWCMPQAVAEKLTLASGQTSQSTEVSPGDEGTEESEWTHLSVHLPESRLSRDDVASIRIGDLIATDHAIDAPVVVRLDNHPTHQAQLVSCENKKAVRIVANLHTEDQPE